MSAEKSPRGRPFWSLVALATLIVLGGGMLQGCGSSAAPSTDLTGQWESNGYTCPPHAPHKETVAIFQSGTHIVATKIVGDDCVNAGHVSFLGTINGKSGTVAFWAATAGGTPSLGQQDQPLKIEGANRFSIPFPGVGLMQFTRAAAGSGGSDWWLWVVLVLVLIAIGVAVAHRRRKRQMARRDAASSG